MVGYHTWGGEQKPLPTSFFFRIIAIRNKQSIKNKTMKTKTNKIKLLKVGELSDGTQRFQSQLYIGKNAADFVMGTDGIMKCWGNGDNGFNFYEYKEPYEIISSKEDMFRQAL